MAEIKDWNTNAAQNNSTPPNGAPEGMARGLINNVMREMMGVMRRAWQAISGELAATTADGATYTLAPAQTITSLTNGLAFVFKVDTVCVDDPVLAVGANSANMKKVSDAGAVNLEAGDLQPNGVYMFVYVTGTGWILVSGGGQAAAAIVEATLTDQNVIAWNAGDSPRAKVTLGGNRTIAAPTNATAGQRVTLRVIQDATGSRTLTWNNAFVWRSGSAPTLSTAANASDVFIFYYDGTNFVELASSIAPPVLTDTQIGDKAFSNPPSDLDGTERTAVRTAIGAGDAAATDVTNLDTRVGDLESFFLTNRKLGRLASDLALTSSSTWQTVASVSITPTSTTSRIKLGVSLWGETNLESCDLRILRGTTVIVSDHNLLDTDDRGEPINEKYVDVPGVTTAVTYTLQAKRAGSATFTVDAGSALYAEQMVAGQAVGERTTDAALSASYQALLSASVTPSSTTAIVEILVEIITRSGNPVDLQLKRGSTVIADNIEFYGQGTTSQGGFFGRFFDVPGVTSSVTYSVELKGSTTTTIKVGSSLELRDKTRGA